MESFIITTVLSGSKKELLIIPDNCCEASVFHLISNGSEIHQIRFTDANEWQVLDGQPMADADLKGITDKIEAYF